MACFPKFYGQFRVRFADKFESACFELYSAPKVVPKCHETTGNSCDATCWYCHCGTELLRHETHQNKATFAPNGRKLSPSHANHDRRPRKVVFDSTTRSARHMEKHAYKATLAVDVTLMKSDNLLVIISDLLDVVY